MESTQYSILKYSLTTVCCLFIVLLVWSMSRSTVQGLAGVAVGQLEVIFNVIIFALLVIAIIPTISLWLHKKTFGSLFPVSVVFLVLGFFMSVMQLFFSHSVFSDLKEFLWLIGPLIAFCLGVYIMYLLFNPRTRQELISGSV